MVRHVWAQLRRRIGRSIALLLGVFIATGGFTILTTATDTSQLVVTQAVEENVRGAFDILVRPKGTRTQFEENSERVRPNYLSDVYGGISRREWEAIRAVPGVQVAAPVAMLGYVRWVATSRVDLTSAVDTSLDRQVLTLTPTWRSERGLSTYVDQQGFVYVTRRPVLWPAFPQSAATEWGGEYSDGVQRDPQVATRLCGSPGFRFSPYEVQEDGSAVPICALGADAQGGTQFRGVSRYVAQLRPDGMFAVNELASGQPALGVARRWAQPQPRLELPIAMPIPLLLAAVDLTQEAALVGLDKAVVFGRFLTASDLAAVTLQPGGTIANGVVPALVSSRPYVDEQLDVAIHSLRDAVVAGRSTSELDAGFDSQTAQQRQTIGLDVATAYGSGQGLYQGPIGLNLPLQAGATEYVAESSGSLGVRPQPPVSQQEGWDHSGVSRMSNDVALRPMRVGTLAPQLGTVVANVYATAVGSFDPELMARGAQASGGFAEIYRAPVASGSDARSKEALGNEALRPNSNPGNYLSTPPAILISLDAFTQLSNDEFPISALRIRVSGIERFDEASRERIRIVAEDIARTGEFDVDIMYSSSPGPQTVVLPEGRYGRPSLTIAELWSHKGVAALIVRAIDHKSLVLFVLILVVSVLFLANAVSAAVRDRRRELAVLACLGWPAWRLGALVLFEVGAIGAFAGGLATAFALMVNRFTTVAVDPARAVTALPIALAVTLAAGVVPALRAARSHPMSAIHPGVRESSRPRKPRRTRGLASFALLQIRRVPGRTALGAAALAVGVCALTLLAGVTIVFHGSVVGTVLGDVVSVRVRSVDVFSAIGTVVLGVAAIADVLYINIRERGNELALLRAAGWSGWTMASFVAFEALGIGTLGAVTGAAAGVGLSFLLTGVVPAELVALAAVTAAGGILLTVAAAVVPAGIVQRQHPALLLADE